MVEICTAPRFWGLPSPDCVKNQKERHYFEMESWGATAECGLAPGAGKTLDFEKYIVFYEVFVPKIEHTFPPLVVTQSVTEFHLCHSK